MQAGTYTFGIRVMIWKKEKVDNFFEPEIVFVTEHVSGLYEIGIGYGKYVKFILSRKSPGIGIISFEEMTKILNNKVSLLNGYKCCCCDNDYSVVDRGAPLCKYHEAINDDNIEKRPFFFKEVEIDWNEMNPLDIVFR